MKLLIQKYYILFHLNGWTTHLYTLPGYCSYIWYLNRKSNFVHRKMRKKLLNSKHFPHVSQPSHRFIFHKMKMSDIHTTAEILHSNGIFCHFRCCICRGSKKRCLFIYPSSNSSKSSKSSSIVRWIHKFIYRISYVTFYGAHVRVLYIIIVYIVCE